MEENNKVFSEETKINYRREMFSFAEKTIYSTRILLIPFYICLVMTLVIYAFTIGFDTFKMIKDFCSPNGIEENLLLIRVLAIVDIVMIANLIVMILIGSYSIFVRKINIGSVEKRPQWLNHISSGSLKVKISMSIVGVSSIHLLKIFIESEDIHFKQLLAKILIHAFFIISAIVMAKTHKIIENGNPNDEHIESH
jgi:uncharacterized protein (TIGR00645 family)